MQLQCLAQVSLLHSLLGNIARDHCQAGIVIQQAKACLSLAIHFFGGGKIALSLVEAAEVVEHAGYTPLGAILAEDDLGLLVETDGSRKIPAIGRYVRRNQQSSSFALTISGSRINVPGFAAQGNRILRTPEEVE